MADNVIDKLSLEVEATAQSASSTLETLQKNLASLKGVLSGINASNLVKVQQQLQGVSNGINSAISSINKASNLSISPKIDTSGISKSEKDIQGDVNKIKQSLAGLNSYANAAMNGDSSSFTSFNRRVISIQSSIDVLRTKIDQLGNTSVKTTAFVDLENKETELETKLADLKSQMDAVLSGTVNISNNAFQQLTEDIVNTRTALDEVSAKQAELISSGGAYEDPFADVRDSLDGFQSDLKTTKDVVTDTFNSVNGQKPKLNVSDVKAGLNEIIDTAKETTSQLLKISSSAVKSGFSSLRSSLSKIKESLSSIGKSSSGAVSTGFSKILKYGFGIRSMYVLFRRLRSAIKDSFTELQKSGAYYQTTNANIQALSNSLSTLKYQFGAAFEPIFNTVAPALQTLINYLVTVMNTISAFIAKLTGKSTYSKAVASTAEIASNTGSAASSAAELNKQLQGFDERNNLDLDSGSSGGGGGGSSSDSGDVTYVEESVENALTSFWDSLSDAITSGDWYKVGSLISTELTDALNSIDWDDIFEAASNFGTGLADFLDGLITDDLFSALGTTIGNSIRTALTAALSFSEEMTENGTWAQLGSAIASGINSFVATNPLELVVANFNSWALGILTTLSTAVKNIEWKTIAQDIADAIGDINASDIGWELGTLVSSLANALYTLVSNKETWTNLGTKIGEGINGFFDSMDEVDAKTGLTGWEALGETIENTFTGLADTLSTALETVEWEDVGQSIADFIGSIDWEKVKWSLDKLKDAIKEALIGLINGLEITDEDLKDIAVTLGKIALVIGAISVVKLGADITKEVLIKKIASAIVSGMGATGSGTATVSLASGGLSTLVLGLAGVAVAIVGGQVIGNAIGQVFASAINDDELLQYYQEYTTWDKWFPELKKAIEDGSFWDGLEMMSDDLFDKTGISKWFNDNVVNQEGFGFFEDAGESISKGANTLIGIIEDTASLIEKKIKKAFTDALSTEFDLDTSNGVNLAIINKVLGTNFGSGTQGASHSFDIDEDKDVSVKIKVDTETKLNGQSVKKDTFDKLTETFKNLTDAANVSTEAEYDATVGGDLNTIDDVDDWRTKFVNLYQKWLGRDAKFTSSEDGFESKIGGWLTKLGELAQKWAGTKPEATFVSKESGLSAFETAKTGYLARLSNIQQAWEGKGQTRTATFTANIAGNLGSSESLSTAASAMSTLNNSFQGDKSASFTVSYSGPSADSLGSTANGVSSINSSFASSSSQSLDYSLTASVDMESVNAAVSKITNAVKKGMSTKWQISQITAKGGIIANGVKFNLPQFAGGTLDALSHGSVFVAGERGPEVMGHINGKTEILNRSQIASVMHASFVDAMADFRRMELTTPQELLSDYSSTVSASASSDISANNNNALLLREQNELLRTQNQILSELLEKPTGISQNDVFDANRNAANDYYNRTGRSPFIF